jgi:hypothetical protein
MDKTPEEQANTATGTSDIASRLYKTLTEFQEAPYDMTLDIPVFALTPQELSAQITVSNLP